MSLMIFSEITLELDDKIESERAYTSLGRVYLAMGLVEENVSKSASTISPGKALKQAEKCFIKGVLLCKELIGQVTKHELADMKARLYLNLSLTKEAAGELHKALDYMTKAIALCKADDLFEILHKCYIAMSTQYVKFNDTQNALRYINLASDVAVRLTDRVAKCCETWIAYASILIKSGDYQSAKQILMKAYKSKSPIEADRQSVEASLRTVAALCKTEDDLIVVYTGDYKRRRMLYEKMGDGSCALGNFEKAAMYYEHALENAKLNKEKDSDLIPLYVSLYETYRDNKCYKKALKYMWAEFDLCKNNPKEAVYTLLAIAETTLLSGEGESTAEGLLRQALKSAKESGDLDLKIRVCLKLLDMFTKSGDPPKIVDLEKELRTMDMTLEALKAHGKRLQDSDDDQSEGKADTPNIGDAIDLDSLSGSDSEPDIDEEETRETKRTSSRNRTANKIKRNAKGETQLHTACIAGNVASVKRLLDAGHPLNVRDHAGWLPLHEAANHGFFEVVALLVEAGGASLINDRGHSSCAGVTPLHDACSNGHLKIVELLLNKGANPTIRTDSGETPLDFLTVWRESESSLDPEREAFYELLRAQLADATKKVCPSKPSSSAVQGKKELQTRSLRRQQSNKENNTRIGNLRRGICDEDDDSNDSISESGLTPSTSSKRKKSEATELYKSAINNLKNNHGSDFNHDFDDGDEGCSKTKRSAYLDSQELEVDDWLEDDLVLHEKKKPRFMTDNPISKKQRPSLSLNSKGSTTKTSSNVIDLSGPELQSTETNSSDTDAFNVIMSAKQRQARKNKSSSSGRSSSKGSSRNQKSLIQTGFTREVLDIEDDDSNDVNDSGITSPIKSNRSSSAINTSTSSISGFVTMKVKIEDQLIVVPVKAVDAAGYTMKWLAENAAKRYEK